MDGKGFNVNFQEGIWAIPYLDRDKVPNKNAGSFPEFGYPVPVTNAPASLATQFKWKQTTAINKTEYNNSGVEPQPYPWNTGDAIVWNGSQGYAINLGPDDVPYAFAFVTSTTYYSFIVGNVAPTNANYQTGNVYKDGGSPELISDSVTFTNWLRRTFAFTYLGQDYRTKEYFWSIIFITIDSSGLYWYTGGDTVSSPLDPDFTLDGMRATKLFATLYKNFYTAKKPPTPTGPGWPGGDTGEGGGDGDGETPDDTVTKPDTTPINAASIFHSGFVMAYNPSVSELRTVASYLWTSDLLTNLKQWFRNPFDTIISVSLLPLKLPTFANNKLVFGNITTDISLPHLTYNVFDFDCGTISIANPHYKSFLDYPPFTRVEIYLPFIGMRELDVDLVMGKTLKVSYRIDVLSLSCVAYITDESGAIISTFSGSIGFSVPISGQNASAFYSGIVQAGASAIGAAALGLATGGAGAAAVAGVGNALASATANSVTNSKPKVQTGGNISPTGGLLSPFTVYARVHSPTAKNPENYNKFYGYTLCEYGTLKQYGGFTSCSDFHLDGVSATSGEKELISQLLKEGIII